MTTNESGTADPVVITIINKRNLFLPVAAIIAVWFYAGQSAMAGSPRSNAPSNYNHPPPIDMSRVLNSRFKKSTSPFRKQTSSNNPNPWQPEAKERHWKYIVLHHTATQKGSVASIHQAHLQRVDSRGNPWRGIGYHFVIGNGNEMKDGKIEPTFRWIDQTEGAHAGNANYNKMGIGICLVGNFDKTRPTSKQLDSLKTLLDILKDKYSIGSKNVVAHKSVKATGCPGKYFPLHLFSQAKGCRGVHYYHRFRLR